MMDKWVQIFTRICFAIACILAVFFIIDRIFWRMGYDLVWIPATHGRLLDLTALALLFTITLLLRQIREAVTKK